VPYATAEARRELLRDVAAAIDEIGGALAALGAAYELLDERAADALEAEVFRPVQTAYGRAQRTHAAFARRHGLHARPFTPRSAGTASRPVGELLEAAAGAVTHADALLAELQDSMRPVEVGDQELRAGLAEVRTLLGPVAARARQVQRLVGR
jgi:hypothetical protein